jgi:hypothetical protein
MENLKRKISFPRFRDLLIVCSPAFRPMALSLEIRIGGSLWSAAALTPVPHYVKAGAKA